MAVARTMKATQDSVLTSLWKMRRRCELSLPSKDMIVAGILKQVAVSCLWSGGSSDVKYDATNNELVCDELGVAYPIVGGIPNLNPQDGRMIEKSKPATDNRNSENS